MRNLALGLGSLMIGYILAEGFYSSLIVHHVIGTRTYYFTEAVDPEGHVRFDPQIGYRMSPVPARYGAVVSDGRLESEGILVGNNYGLPDPRDFHPEKTDSSILRIAVLGDSFTASQFTERSWIQFLEDSLNRSVAHSLELLNFSVDGGGLANWHGILKHILLKDGFDIDAVIYAVLGDDLDRKFHYRHEYLVGEEGNLMEERSVGVGYHHNWREQSYPSSPATADVWFSDGWLVLSSDEIDAIEAGEWEMPIPWKPYFFHDLWHGGQKFIGQLVPTAAAESQPDFERDQEQVMHQLRFMHELLGVPVLCLSFSATPDQRLNAEMFASIINADYLQEVEPDPETGIDWKSLYIEGDGHWTKAGAKFFADNNYRELKNWMVGNLNIDEKPSDPTVR